MRINGVIAPCDLTRVKTLLHPWTEPGSNTRLFLLFPDSTAAIAESGGCINRKYGQEAPFRV